MITDDEGARATYIINPIEDELLGVPALDLNKCLEE